MISCNPLEAFEIKPHDVISLVGCNGKTTLMNLIADYASHTEGYQPILLSTTTKIRACEPSSTRAVFSSAHDFSSAYADSEDGAHPAVGVLYGSLLADKTGTLSKFNAPSTVERAHAIAHARLSLFEADGSRGLPLKGWRDFEPVIDPHTTITIGILPLSAFSLEISPERICAFETFETTFKDALKACCARTPGSNQTDPGFIAEVIQHEKGLFKDAHHTRWIFFINQVDTEQDYLQACAYVECLRSSGVTCDIISGSAQHARFYRMNA